MADTASLIARVKTEGVEEASRQLTALGRTSEQVDAAITRMTGDVGKTNKAMSDAARGGLSSFRNAAGQVGSQVQDMVVQLQSGTSEFVAIGQQGSQLASAFGPGGAVLGAVIAFAAAVGGVLYESLTDAEGSTKDLEAAQKQLKDTFQQTTSGTLELTDGMIQLTQISKEAAETQLALAQANAELISQQTAKAVQEDAKSWETWKASTSAAISQYDSLIAKGADVNSTLTDLSGTYEGNIVGVNILSQNIAELSDKFGVNQQQALDMIAAQSEFNKQPTAENARKISDIFTDWLGNTKKLNPELIRLSTNANNNATALESAEKAASAAADAQKKLGTNTNETTQRIKEQNDALISASKIAGLAERDRFAAQAKADKEAFAKRKGVTKAQIEEFNKARDKEAEVDLAKFDKREAEKTSRLTSAAAKREASAAKRDETAARRQQKQADDFLNLVARTNQDEFKAIDAKEKQKLEKLQKFNEMGRIVGKQFEDAKTQIALDADTERNELLQKQTEERMKKQDSADNFIAQLRAQNEGELAEIDRQENAKLKKLEEFKAQGLDIEGGYQAAKENIAAAFDKERVAKYSSMLGQTTDDLKTALGEGNKAYKAFAIANAIMQTYVGATAAFQSAAAIPIVGWIAAPIAAAAAVATGLANVAKIRSAREQGGSLAAGGIAMVGERNKAELIMPAGASRVRTMEQVQQMMGENGSKSGGDSVTIVNQTSGRVDSATTERDDEGRLRIIISETVASALQDSNSQISKSRRSTRGQPGF